MRVFAHHRDGHLVPVMVWTEALRDGDGRIVGAVEGFRDDSSGSRPVPEVEHLAALTGALADEPLAT